ncbi:MAG: NosD domain-containing protein [Chloroflexota bacterium]|nr:NosD domain-containing protein [Chloroflexota bacterium]
MTSRSALAGLLVLSILSVCLPMAAYSASLEIHVGPNYTHQTIQQAVDAATTNDIIILHDTGTEPDYKENVKVHTDHLIIKEADGEIVTIEGSAPDDHVFSINANYVMIFGLDIYGATQDGFSAIYVGPGTSQCIIRNNHCGYDATHRNSVGILLESAIANTIEDNSCSDNSMGILLDSSNDNTISSNNCHNNINSGIFLWASSANLIRSNTCYRNGDDGLFLRNSSGNAIRDNISHNNSSNGIQLRDSAGNIVANNTIHDNNSDGISLKASSDNFISINSCYSNIDNGIYLIHSSGNTISSNTCVINSFGISIRSSSQNLIRGNACRENFFGIKLSYSSDTIIYLNDFTNNTTSSLYSQNSLSIWNSPDEMTYIYDGISHISSLGNHWSDFNGLDTDNNGIRDIAYEIDVNEKDAYPLMHPIIPGDINWDGIVDGRDLVNVKKIILGLLDTTPGADANGDGNTNGQELIAIKKTILGIGKHFE